MNEITESAGRQASTHANKLDEIAASNQSPEEKARAFGGYFAISSASTARLSDEFANAHLRDIEPLFNDAKKCLEAIDTDQSLIARLDAFSADPNNTKLKDNLVKDIRDDLKGDHDALIDDPKNAHRAAYLAGLDQAILDNPNFKQLLDKPAPNNFMALGADGHHLSVREMIAIDRDDKLADIANCLKDIPNELKAIAHDDVFLKALKSGNQRQIQEAMNAVRADKKEDIGLEGRSYGDAGFGLGYIGADQRSAGNDVLIARLFNKLWPRSIGDGL